MTHLTRDQIFKASDFKTQVIEVKEWGGTLMVRGLSGVERAKLERMFGLGKDMGAPAPKVVKTNGVPEPTWENWRFWVVAMCAVDENMKAVFTPSDVEQLGYGSAGPLDRVANAVLAMSGISKEETEEMGKDSEGTTGDSSSSA